MHTVLTVLFTYYSHLFVDDPRAAFLLRTSSWKVRKEFDKLSDPVVWWLWIHHFFIPNIVGLPFSQNNAFYTSLLNKYHTPFVGFSEQMVRVWKKQRCLHMSRIGYVLNYSPLIINKMAKRILRINSNFMKTAQGRAFFLDMINEWEECYCIGGYQLNVIREVKNYAKFSFRLSPVCMDIEAGYSSS
jgi:hypothetical protein